MVLGSAKDDFAAGAAATMRGEPKLPSNIWPQSAKQPPSSPLAPKTSLGVYEAVAADDDDDVVVTGVFPPPAQPSPGSSIPQPKTTVAAPQQISTPGTSVGAA